VSHTKEYKDRQLIVNDRYRYGIEPEEKAFLYKSQDDKCAICNKEGKLFIDHCHESNQVRGLLCHHCNVGIGMLQNNIGNLLAAIEYINESERYCK